jgi:hypothetical protein
MSINTSYSGEVQFAGYSDSSRSGPRITLRLSDRLDLEAFVGAEGKRYMLALVEIGDDEKPVQPVHVASIGPLCRWAVLRCKEEQFQLWIKPVYDRVMGGDGSGFGDVTPEDSFDGDWSKYAGHCIKVMTGVSSRRELDIDKVAAAKFKTLIMEPYGKTVKT